MSCPFPHVAILLLAAVCPAATLEISRATLHAMPGGPAVTGTGAFQAGDFVHGSVQVDGYQITPEKKIHLTYEWRAEDPGGVAVVPAETGQIAEELQPEDKDWKPGFTLELSLPSYAPSGAYRLVMRVTDKMTGATAERVLPFQVKGRAIEPGAPFAAQSFGYYTSEDAPRPLSAPVYSAGSTVHARFDITGYQFGPKNRFTVRYGITVRSPEGRVMLAREDAATLSDESFYPQRVVSGGFQFTTPKDTKPGEYTVTLTLTDEAANRKVESTHPVRVE